MVRNQSFAVNAGLLPDGVLSFLSQYDLDALSLFPGFCDVHVHLREPGFSYKETIATGSMAAAHGGYTTVCAMPNLKPVPDSIDSLRTQLDIIRRDAAIEVLPYGAITRSEKGEELADMESMAADVIAFSDDGKGVQSESMMRSAMERAACLHKIIAAHCEDNSMLHGGVIHAGVYASQHGIKGICSESEYGPIARDIRLAKETGCAYHVCHISCRESVDLIRQAKKDGVDISCETAPHYLLLDESDLRDEGRFKMNPPLRSRADREALIEGVLDGTIDMIATDHAPHSNAEKARGLTDSPFGIVGIETAFQTLYTGLVKTSVLPLERLIELLSEAPRRRFGLPCRANDYTVWDLNTETTVDPDAFLSKGKATPFAGQPIYGKCLLTVINGKIVYHA